MANPPKVFIGGRELTGEQLTTDTVKKLIAGPSGIFSDAGYVPINPSRSYR